MSEPSLASTRITRLTGFPFIHLFFYYTEMTHEVSLVFTIRISLGVVFLLSHQFILHKLTYLHYRPREASDRQTQTHGTFYNRRYT